MPKELLYGVVYPMYIFHLTPPKGTFHISIQSFIPYIALVRKLG